MIRDIIDGLTSYLTAWKTIREQRLWHYFFIPAIISLILAILIFGTIWGTSSQVGAWIYQFYPWEIGRSFVEKSASIVGGILMASVGLILYKNAVMALSSPFMSLLSERIEKNLFDDVVEQPMSLTRWMQETVRGIRIGLRNIIREIFFSVFILILALLPIVAPFSAALIFLIQSYYAGFGSMDYTLERHFNIRDSVGFVRNNRGLAIGNGSIFILLLMTGFGFLIALPWSTVAATQEVMKRLD